MPRDSPLSTRCRTIRACRPQRKCLWGERISPKSARAWHATTTIATVACVVTVRSIDDNRFTLRVVPTITVAVATTFCADAAMRNPRLQRLLVLFSLLAFAGASLGFPSLRLAKVPPKDRSKPFPCQDSPCGCMSADQCWKSCCCRTNVEKLAWAKANGVTLPAFVEIAAQKETKQAKACCSKNSSTRSSSSSSCCSKSHATEKRELAKSAGSCDQEPTKPSCCTKHADKLAHSCGKTEGKTCQSKSGVAGAPATRKAKPDNQKENSETRWQWVHGISALKCHALSYDWLSVGACEVPTIVLFEIELFQTDRVTPAPANLLSIEDSPEIRPPRADFPAILA